MQIISLIFKTISLICLKFDVTFLLDLNISRKIIDFLVLCSGADKGVLHEAELESPKYTSIGAAILLTAVLASLSGGYAIYSSFNSVPAAVFFGILWSLIIFNLDRYIVVSIDKNTSVYRQITMAVPRLLISFLLAITISKPLELRIFQGSINNKLYEKDVAELLIHDSIIGTKKKSLKKELARVQRQSTADVILSDYENDKKPILKQQDVVLRNIKYEQDTVRKKILLGRLAVINRRLYSVDSLINKRKNKIYSEIIETENLNAEVKRRVYKELFAADSLNTSQVKEIKDKQTNRDMLVRLKALSDLKASDDTMAMTGNLITLLFILIEMAPVLIKLMSKKGLYEAVILARHNELYLKQKSKEEDNNRMSNLKDKLWTLMEKNELSMNAYMVKKRSQLSKVTTDKWYTSEVAKLKKL